MYKGIVSDDLNTMETRYTKLYETWKDAHDAAEKLCKRTMGSRGSIGVREVIKDSDKESIRIRYGKSEIIKSEGNNRLIRFNGRFYTAYGRMFAVAGNHLATDWDTVCDMKHYQFCDWETLSDMYAE
jgi:hypothetical protein